MEQAEGRAAHAKGKVGKANDRATKVGEDSIAARQELTRARGELQLAVYHQAQTGEKMVKVEERARHKAARANALAAKLQ